MLKNSGSFPRGRTYKEGSVNYIARGLQKYIPAGERTFSKVTQQWYKNLPGEFKNQFVHGGVWESLKNFGSDTYIFQKGDVLGNVGKALGYVGVGVGVYSSVQQNIREGETKATDYIADVAVEAGTGLASMAVATGCAKVGAAIGSAIPIPVVGTVVGAAAGFALGYVGNKVFNSIMNDERKDQ